MVNWGWHRTNQKWQPLTVRRVAYGGTGKYSGGKKRVPAVGKEQKRTADYYYSSLYDCSFSSVIYIYISSVWGDGWIQFL